MPYELRVPVTELFVRTLVPVLLPRVPDVPPDLVEVLPAEP